MEQRLMDLEVRYTYLERTVGELDQVILELRAEVARLRRELEGLRSVHDAGDQPNPPHEKPPHY
jgi:SlyX protein